MPCTSLGFECAGDEEMAEDLFEEKKDEAGDDDGENHMPEAECVPTTSTTTTVEGGPSTSWTTTVRQEDQVREAEVEGEVVSRREAPKGFKKCIPYRRSLGTSTNVPRGQGPEIPLISLMLHMLPPLSQRTLDTFYLMQTRSILCMRSWEILRGTRCGS
jgi:hypothetical protein